MFVGFLGSDLTVPTPFVKDAITSKAPREIIKPTSHDNMVEIKAETHGPNPYLPQPRVTVAVSVSHRVAYIVMPKSASKTIGSLLQGLKAKRMPLLKFAKLYNDDYFVFTFVRDPMAHVISGLSQIISLVEDGTRDCLVYSEHNDACKLGGSSHKTMHERHISSPDSTKMLQLRAHLPQVSMSSWRPLPSCSHFSPRDNRYGTM